jgi:phage shock protein PspC (stress-responsive transcriptional regulator)
MQEGDESKNNLYRSSDEKVIAGVCAGLAHKFDLNATGLRWVVALVTLFLSGVPLIVYAVLWVVLKARPTSGVIDV